MNKNELTDTDRDGVVTSPSTSRRSLLKSAAGLFGSLLLPALARADDLWTTYQTPAAFLAEAFGATPPPPKVLVLDASAQARLSVAFGRNYPQAQIRYWRANGRTAWILDDLGKVGYQLTTSGFVVKDKAIDFARVLIYRESRGEQIAEASFLKKIAGARYAGSGLDRTVDNISGATLSVKMMERMAAAALVLDSLAPV
jgi:hypothetical protein